MHEISINKNTGKAEAMYSLQPAWHSLGQVLDHVATSEEAIVESGLDFPVEKQELVTVKGLKVHTKVATVRTDTNEVLAVVGDGYEVVQNVEAFSFLDSLLMDGVMKYESAGALHGGQKIWVLAKMPSVDTIADGDDVLRYLLWVSGHNGLVKINCFPTSVRVVCQNTLTMALQGVSGGFLHTSTVRERMQEAKLLISQYDERFTLFRDHARILATKKYTKEQAQEYINELFPKPEEDKSSAVRDRKVEAVRQALRHDTQIVKSIRGTFWALANAVSHSIDHAQVKSTPKNDAVKRRRAEKRFESLIEGPAADFKNRAFELAFSMAGIAV